MDKSDKMKEVKFLMKEDYKVMDKRNEKEEWMNHKILDEYTSEWFREALGEPTQVQKEAWVSISQGKDTLVSAPTGTGKTLSAFLVFLNQLKGEARRGELRETTKVLYISPLKSLAGDIRENLDKPLAGITQKELLAGIQPGIVNLGLRTGDTTPSERQKMIKHPPHILITTPESFYLLLTSKTGKKILSTIQTIILDELHAIMDSKRGAHLMLSVARLEKLNGGNLQRIGLSATIEPLYVAADYLSPNPVTVVAPNMKKDMVFRVKCPYKGKHNRKQDRVWKDLAASVYQYCQEKRSVIAFVEGRMYAEKLAYYVNQIGGDDFARTHHGSMAKEQRLDVEAALRGGTLRLLCATSSMELGIDVGEIDQVLQVGCPRTISSTLQRLGRAGHNPGRKSVMYLFPRTSSEGLFCGLTVQAARKGKVEKIKPPRQCLDVLAQHLVSMAVDEGYYVSSVMELLKRAYPFSQVTKEQTEQVLAMLAGDYEHQREIPVRPRIIYDRKEGYVQGDAYSRMLAISAGGTIPDKGMYTVKNDRNVKIGEVDEEFVFEAKTGDKFLLGTFAWKITGIDKNAVYVTQTNNEGAQSPFWKGDIKGRGRETGEEFGRQMRLLGKIAKELGKEALIRKLQKMGLDQESAEQAGSFLLRQLQATKVLPDDKTIVMEHIQDETIGNQIMVHSLWGRKINGPMAVLIQQFLALSMNCNVHCVEDENGFLIYPYGEQVLPTGFMKKITSDMVRPILESSVLKTPLFNMVFRYNANRALMMGIRKQGRQPLWVQRIRSAELLDRCISYDFHPLIQESKRECLEDFWDISGLEELLDQIATGEIILQEVWTTGELSPMALPLQWQAEAMLTYDYNPTPSSVIHASQEELKKVTDKMMIPDKATLHKLTKRKKEPEDEYQLHSLFMMEGDLLAEEITFEKGKLWLEDLLNKGRVVYCEPGLFIAAEHEAEYVDAREHHVREALEHILRRTLRYRGGMTAEELMRRYYLPKEVIESTLSTLVEEKEIILQDHQYYHGALYERARKSLISERRNEIRTVPAENFSAFLVNRFHVQEEPKEQLRRFVDKMLGVFYPAAHWEELLFPSYVDSYRTPFLDELLQQGEVYWEKNPLGEVAFFPTQDIDWDVETAQLPKLSEEETIIYQGLQKRGASFVQGLNSLIPGKSSHDILLALMEKGLVRADSFLPVRQWIQKDAVNKAGARAKANARVTALTTGRWEILRPRKQKELSAQLEELFLRYGILSKEFIPSAVWNQALPLLGLMEYTGQVRRGYFVEELSGMQFVKSEEFQEVVRALDHPKTSYNWLLAIDPAQAYGKYLPYPKGKSFVSVPGNLVGLDTGKVIATLERQGKQFRTYEKDLPIDLLELLAKEFMDKKVLKNQNRISIKEYPEEIQEELKKAGFRKEIKDYILYK